MLFNLVRSLLSADRAQKRAILVGYDLAAMALALWAAFSARLGELYFPGNLIVLAAAGISFFVGLLALSNLQVYRLVLRYFDIGAVGRILAAAALTATAWVIAIYFTRAQIIVDGIEMSVPRSVGFIYCVFLFLLLFIGRYLMALLISGAIREPFEPSRAAECRKVAIYGANGAGKRLAESMRDSRTYRLVAIVDDDEALHGQLVASFKVHSPAVLGRMASSGEVEEVFLALPSATRAQRLSAISEMTRLNLQVKTIPAPEEIASGRFTVSDVRPIDVNDLLRRDPVQPLSDLIRKAAEGRTILITGAGGSIGSEICRQIALARPKRLVLLDHSEFNLYSIEQQLEELRQRLPQAERPDIVPIVGSMLNDLLVRDTIARNGVDTIYHAAAYKHVPLLEHNEVIAAANNTIGTFVLARAALEAKLDRFTMISTDKAVRPESVMGASKRAAELVIQAFSEQADCQTRFGIVRFGNVLDSSGSVVQRFRKQIREGGPVTVTHQDVTRFFMSIPEATQLVLQASAMADGGEVFVLDMGEPVKIADLARNMIRLSGMTVRDSANPYGDVEIVYVGLRPGEKLYEELFVGENTLETAHPRIKMAKERFLPMEELQRHLDRLMAGIHEGDAASVRKCLRDLVEPDQAKLGENVAIFRRA